jgi:hypothetical protein
MQPTDNYTAELAVPSPSRLVQYCIRSDSQEGKPVERLYRLFALLQRARASKKPGSSLLGHNIVSITIENSFAGVQLERATSSTLRLLRRCVPRFATHKSRSRFFIATRKLLFLALVNPTSVPKRFSFSKLTLGPRSRSREWKLITHEIRKGDGERSRLARHFGLHREVFLERLSSEKLTAKQDKKRRQQMLRDAV